MGGKASRERPRTGSLGLRRESVLETIAERQWPCNNRHHIIHLISANVSEGHKSQALKIANQLSALFGIGEPDDGNIDPKEVIVEPSEHDLENFVLDRRATVLMHNMVGFIENTPPDWKEQVHMICDELSCHVTPPSLRGSYPLDDIPIRELVLTSLDLYKTITKVNTLRGIIDRNRGSITKIEMSYTGITNDNFKILLPTIASLEFLVFLGLKGNRLDKTILIDISTLMENRKKFRNLIWVDLRNNVDIFTVPKKYLDQLKQRWDPDGHQPTFRALAELEATSQLNLGEP